MKAREVIKILSKNGWHKERQSGSHVIVKDEVTGRTYPIPDHGSEDLGKGLVGAIEKFTGVRLR